MKAKSKLIILYKLFESRINTSFKPMIIIMLCLSIYAIVGPAYNSGIIDGAVRIFNSNWYVLGLVTMILYNTNDTVKLFMQNKFIVSRLKSKKEYLSYITSSVFISNTILMTINLLILFIGLIIFKYNSDSNKIELFYEISNLNYFIFTYLKIYIIIMIITLINSCLYQIFDSKIISFITIIILAYIMFVIPLELVPIQSITNVIYFLPINIIFFFYNSFVLELQTLLISTVLYIGILVVIKNLTYKLMRDVSE